MNDVSEALKEIEGLEAARKFPAALDAVQQAMRQFPKARPVAVKLAELLEICRQHDQAIALYTRLHEETQKQGGKTEVKILIGMANCQIRKSLYDQATKILEQLQPLAPDNPDILAALASCRRHKGRLGEAETLLNHALKTDPGHKQALHEMAEVYLANKEVEKAIELLERNIRRPDIYGDSIDLWLATLEKLNRNRYAQETLEELVGSTPKPWSLSLVSRCWPTGRVRFRWRARPIRRRWSSAPTIRASSTSWVCWSVWRVIWSARRN